MKNKLIAFVSFVIAAVMAVSFCACSGGKQPAVPAPGSLDISGIATRIFNDCTFEDTSLVASPNPEFVLGTVYGADNKLVAGEDGAKSIAVYNTSSSPEMIICAEAVDAASAKKLMDESIKPLIDNYINNYTSYGPEQVQKLKSAVTEVAGTYVICVVSADNAKAAEVVGRLLSGEK